MSILHYISVHSFSCGAITIESNGTAITAISFGEPACVTIPVPELHYHAVAELAEYFFGMRTNFDLPICQSGTPFQLAVWNALADIPYGETRSYKDIACAIGKPSAARAVGGANHRNPLCVIIPCHRVIASDGSIGGYAGGIHIKEYLLNLEHSAINRQLY